MRVRLECVSLLLIAACVVGGESRDHEEVPSASAQAIQLLLASSPATPLDRQALDAEFEIAVQAAGTVHGAQDPNLTLRARQAAFDFANRGSSRAHWWLFGHAAELGLGSRTDELRCALLDSFAERYGDAAWLAELAEDPLTQLAHLGPSWEEALTLLPERVSDERVATALRFARASVYFRLNPRDVGIANSKDVCAELLDQVLASAYHEECEAEARAMLFSLRTLREGSLAPDVAAVDTDDRPFRLSDYRGRVVLLVFWGFW